jgi:hypothetical protein
MLMLIMYLKPYQDFKTQLTHEIQELVTMGITYHLFLFTDFVDVERRVEIANSVIIIVYAQSAFFFLLLV